MSRDLSKFLVLGIMCKCNGISAMESGNEMDRCSINFYWTYNFTEKLVSNKGLSILDRMEALSDNLTRIRNQKKCFWIMFFDKVSKFYSL